VARCGLLIHDAVIVGGGQSGLAAARALHSRGLRPVVLEAGPEPVGSWPYYYDSLTVFSPVEYSSMPGLPFPGDPDHYPHRDEVIDYLRTYAAGLDVDIRTNTRVTAVDSDGDGGFVVHAAGGDEMPAAAVVAASGSYARPRVPAIPGRAEFGGRVLHVADYRNPKPLLGERVVVVGAGDSAVQVGYELADDARVTLATRHPVVFLPQHREGRDVHYWLAVSGFDDLPPGWLAQLVPTAVVTDTGDYQRALESGRFDQRRMFTRFARDGVVWSDGTAEPVDTVLFATGYRPSVDYLQPLSALRDGLPLHTGGLSTTHRGLAFVGLEYQRSYASNTLRGVHRDADYIAAPLAAHIRGASAMVGL
jgi:putative flavoprotein involved in K+ transport